MSVVLDVIVHITNGSKRNSDPRLRIVFFHGWNTNFDSKLEVLKGRRDFQNRSNSRVSRSSFLLQEVCSCFRRPFLRTSLVLQVEMQIVCHTYKTVIWIGCALYCKYAPVFVVSQAFLPAAPSWDMIPSEVVWDYGFAPVTAVRDGERTR